VHAALGSAAVIGTGVLVVAGERVLSRGAGSVAAQIAQAAGVSIVAGDRVGGSGAARQDVTAVVCAGVQVVAGERLGRLAGAVCARVAQAAGVSVITGEGVGQVHAALGSTAVIGTRVPIITAQSVRSSAHAVLAQVPQGARVAVVTHGDDHLGLAASKPIAGVLRAGVLVVAVDGGTDADAGLAVISDRTGVTVEALTLCEVGVLAARLACTGVHCAGVLVVAEVLVDLAITVVIEPIAGLQGRLISRAGRQAL
jgi:hypothetical protein